MKLVRSRFISACIVLLAGCANEHVAFALTEAPVEWQSASSERYRATSCPMISGSYTSKGTARVFRRVDGKPQAPQDESVGAWRIGYSDRAGARELLDATDSRVPKGINLDEVYIVQASETRYEVYRPQKIGKIDVDVFDSSLGDFQCADGTIFLPTDRRAGSSEGTTRHSELTISIRVAQDGTLIVRHHHISKASSLFFFRGEVVSEGYARFPRAKPPSSK